MKLEYDSAKNDLNIASRGLSFDLAARFDFTTALIWQDKRKTYDEDRFCALGYIDARLHALVFTPRGDAMRVVSLRKANNREVTRYEEATES